LRELLSTFVNALISAEPDAVYGARRYRGLDVLARAVAATKEVTEQPIIQALTPNYIPHHHGGIGGDRDFETLLVRLRDSARRQSNGMGIGDLVASISPHGRQPTLAVTPPLAA
jgi:hypothetical protein